MKEEKDLGIINNISLEVLRTSRKKFEREGGHHRVEKIIEGEFRLDGSPAFVAEIRSDLSSHIVASDEPGILGGRGVHASPLSYVLFGVLACFANTLAIQCGLKGVSLRKMKLRGRLFYDIGPMLTNAEGPLIKELRIEVEADRDVREVIETSKERCPALYLVDHAIKTEVLQAGTRNSKRPVG